MTLLNRTITVVLEKPLYGGFCLGRYEGKAVMVPNAVPGETVRARIYEEKKDYDFGVIEEIVEGSEFRIRPKCVHFESCGGCSYLHLPYGKEQELKKSILGDSLARNADMTPAQLPEIEVKAGERFHYRSHASVKVRGPSQGFFRKGTNDLVPFHKTGCLILADEINDWIRQRDMPRGDYRIAVDSSNRVITSENPHTVVIEKTGVLTFSRGIDQFFQANRFLRGIMQEIVASYGDINGDESFLDIGCGVGFFTLHLAKRMREGTGIDISRESILYARRNAGINKIRNAEFQQLPSARIHPARMRPDLIVIDPPRAGIDRKTRKTLLAISPQKMVYVSCNPATFSRDAKEFIAGGYRMERLMLIDMFPCTHHIEVMARFTRR
jgi:tRNA/tmRNA/rRNA uracil-C5-methylase (TrmA/RlmC/RlmD family)